MHGFTSVIAVSVWVTAVARMETRFGLLTMPKGRPVEVHDTIIAGIVLANRATPSHPQYPPFRQFSKIGVTLFLLPALWYLDII
jgi:hypothetical protein